MAKTLYMRVECLSVRRGDRDCLRLLSLVEIAYEVAGPR